MLAGIIHLHHCFCLYTSCIKAILHNVCGTTWAKCYTVIRVNDTFYKIIIVCIQISCLYILHFQSIPSLWRLRELFSNHIRIKTNSLKIDFQLFKAPVSYGLCGFEILHSSRHDHCTPECRCLYLCWILSKVKYWKVCY